MITIFVRASNIAKIMCRNLVPFNYQVFRHSKVQQRGKEIRLLSLFSWLRNVGFCLRAQLGDSNDFTEIGRCKGVFFNLQQNGTIRGRVLFLFPYPLIHLFISLPPTLTAFHLSKRQTHAKTWKMQNTNTEVKHSSIKKQFFLCI